MHILGVQLRDQCFARVRPAPPQIRLFFIFFLSPACPHSVLWRRPQNSPPPLCPSSDPRPCKDQGPDSLPSHRTRILPFLTSNCAAAPQVSPRPSKLCCTPFVYAYPGHPGQLCQQVGRNGETEEGFPSASQSAKEALC